LRGGYAQGNPGYAAAADTLGVEHNAVRLQLLGLPVSLLPPHAVQGPQVDQDVDEGVEVGDSLAVAQPGPLDAEFLGLRVDTLGGSALPLDGPVDVAIAVDLIADARALVTIVVIQPWGHFSCWMQKVFQLVYQSDWKR
jgi:hypothetical protein